MRTLPAVLVLLLASTAVLAQPYDSVVAGNTGRCFFGPPVIGNSLEWPGARYQGISAAVAIAPAPGGRVFAAVQSLTFSVAELRPDGTLTPLTAAVAGLKPLAMVVDRAGAAYVLAYAPNGLNSIVAFNPDGSVRATYPLSSEFVFLDGGVTQETAIDLAPDQCTLFLIEGGTRIRRFDVCAGAFLANFGAVGVEGTFGHGIRVLPDGGVLVAVDDAGGAALRRFDPSGALVRRYPVTGRGWALMLRDGGSRAIYGEAGCQGGRLVTIDLQSGQTASSLALRLVQAPTSIVSTQGWTAAIGPSHLGDVPTMSTIAIAVLGALIAAAALMRLH